MRREMFYQLRMMKGTVPQYVLIAVNNFKFLLSKFASPTLYTLAALDTSTRPYPTPIMAAMPYVRFIDGTKFWKNDAGPISRNEVSKKELPMIDMIVGYFIRSAI